MECRLVGLKLLPTRKMGHANGVLESHLCCRFDESRRVKLEAIVGHDGDPSLDVMIPMVRHYRDHTDIGSINLLFSIKK